jgi:hypothetical protein
MKCACGCGRDVPFRQARDNARARAAAKLVGAMESRDFAADADEYRRAFLFEGVSWRNQYTRIVHGELTRNEIRSDAAWKAWRRGARGAVRARSG